MKKSLPMVVKVLSVQLDETRNEPAYENGGHWRTDRWFRLMIEVNGKAIPSELHLYRMHTKAGKTVPGWEPGWTASLDMNVDGTKEYEGYGCECMECNGNRGRSGPKTSGDTARAVGIAVVEAMKGQGYEITSKYHDWVKRPDIYVGPLSLFTMRIPAKDVVKVGESKIVGWNVVDKFKVKCPVHGSIISKQHETALG